MQKLELELAELAYNTAARYLLSNECELAVAAALQALRFRADLHGSGSSQLVPAYLQLGEASAGLNKLSQAEEYLAIARWLVLKVVIFPFACADRCRMQVWFLNCELDYTGSLVGCISYKARRRRLLANMHTACTGHPWVRAHVPSPRQRLHIILVVHRG